MTMDKRKIEFEILRDILKISNSTLDLHERLNQVVAEIVEKMEVDACAIYLMNRRRPCLSLKAAVGFDPGCINTICLDVGEGITGWVAREKTPSAVRDIFSDSRTKLFAGSGEERYRSMISAPILFLDKCLGVLDVWTVEERVFDQDEIHLLCSIADGISGSIRNAQLYLDVSRQYEDLVSLYEISKTLTSTLEFQEIIGMLTRKSTELIGASGAILRFVDASENKLHVRSMYGLYHDLEEISRTILRLGEGVSGQVAMTGSAQMINDPAAAEGLLPSEKIFASILCVPLMVKERIIGTLSLHDKVDSKGVPAPFNQDDMDLMMAVANQGALVVENARNFERAEQLSGEN
ncbi:MAG: GAF domain-containing protein, partial [bacterium]|nr:GAF domain-containing protein [bacterium]